MNSLSKLLQALWQRMMLRVPRQSPQVSRPAPQTGERAQTKPEVQGDQDAKAQFLARKARSDAARADALAQAKALAKNTSKEPFSGPRYIQLVVDLDQQEQGDRSDWDPIVAEAEYDYYVRYPDKMSLREFIDYEIWLDGWS